MVNKTILIISLISILGLGIINSHLDTGQDITKNSHIIDFGYSPEKPVAGETSNFAINLVDEATEMPLNITKVWIRISKGNDVFFAGTFSPEKASTAFTYVFPESGNYTLDAKFYNSKTLIEEQSIFIDVKGSENNRLNYLYIAAFAFIIYLLIRIKNQGKK